MQPVVEIEQSGQLTLIRAHVHGAADTARVAIQVASGSHVGVVPGVDAGRVGLQTQVAVGVVYEQGVIGDIAHAVGGERYGAAIVESAVSVGGVVVRAVWCRVGINDAVVERAWIAKLPAAAYPAAVTSGVAAQRAVVERAVIRPAALTIAVTRTQSLVALQRAVIKRTDGGPSAVCPTAVANQRAVIERATIRPTTVFFTNVAGQGAVVERAVTRSATRPIGSVGTQRAVVKRAARHPALKTVETISSVRGLVTATSPR